MKDDSQTKAMHERIKKSLAELKKKEAQKQEVKKNGNRKNKT